MRSMAFKLFLNTSFSRFSSKSTSSLPFFLSSFQRIGECSFSSASGGSEYHVFLDGLNWALAGKGVIVKDKAFRNLETSELLQKGARIEESLSELPVHVRGNIRGEASEISKLQFSKLLKQVVSENMVEIRQIMVTTHLSSVADVYIHDGAIGSSSKCDAKVCIISDSPSAVLGLSSILWKATSRAISHDSCPLTVYVASSISQGMVEAVGLGPQAKRGVIAADIERASLILCGKAFSDANATKEALAALAEPVLSARGGLPLPARLLVSGDAVILLFAPEVVIQSCADKFVSEDAGVVLSFRGCSPYFAAKNSRGPGLLQLPTAAVLTTSDSSGTIPSLSKLSPGQAAYHFLAGYQNCEFVPARNRGPSSIDALELAKAFLSKLKENEISTFLINVNGGEKSVTGKDFVSLVQSVLSSNIPFLQHKGGEVEAKYKSFLWSKFEEIPNEFSF